MAFVRRRLGSIDGGLRDRLRRHRDPPRAAAPLANSANTVL